MYAGRVVERAPGAAIFDDPQHPYTLRPAGQRCRRSRRPAKRLLAIEGTVPSAVRPAAGLPLPSALRLRRCGVRARDPRCGRSVPRSRACIRAPIEAACMAIAGRDGRRRLRMTAPTAAGGRRPRQAFPRPARLVFGTRSAWCARWTAFRFTLGRGETLALVGESGCGKSTTGAAGAAADRADRRHDPLRGRRHHRAQLADALRRLRRRMQIVFQDPYRLAQPAHARGRRSSPSR